MNNETFEKHTASYDEYLHKKLSDFEFAKTYLETAFEDYEEDGDTDALLYAMRDVAEAQGKAEKLTIRIENLVDSLSGLGFHIQLKPHNIPAHVEVVSAEAKKVHA